MKKIYTGLFIIFFASNINAQLFEEVIDTPFDGVLFSSIAFADVDNDGDQDVLITGLTGAYRIAKLYLNDGNGDYSEDTETPFDKVEFSSIAFADVDNDSDQDVLITGRNNSNQAIAKLYENDGDGNFEEIIGTSFEGVYKSSIAFTDVDGDNDQDVLITGDKGNWDSPDPITKLYTNDGNGIYTEVIDTPFEGVRNSSIAFSDIDNDNDQDVLITGDSSSTFGVVDPISKLYTNDGDGFFSEVTEIPFEGVGNSSIAFADIDNDNDQDVLITGSTEFYQKVSILYSNDGDGNFIEVIDSPFVGVSDGSIAFTDVDNDDDQDVLITGSVNAKLYTNDGIGNFTIVTDNPFEEVYSSSVDFADIDNDNDQDVLITGRTGSMVNVSKLYRNLSPVGIDENNLFSSVAVYPNPSSGQVNISLGNLTGVTIKVISLSGQSIYYKENINTPIYQFELEAAPGVYILELSAEGENQQFKLIKK